MAEPQTAIAPEPIPSPDHPVEIRHAEPDHATCVLVDWMLGNACNHACSYCPTALHDGSIPWQKTRDILDFYDLLDSHYQRALGRRVWLQFTGGEPTMHPQIARLLAEASARGFGTSLISNGGRTLRFWEEIAPLLDSAVLTYHDEEADHAHFLDVAALLAEMIPLHVNVTVHPDRFEPIMARAAEIDRAIPGASLSLKPLRVDFGPTLYRYTAEQMARLAAGSRGAGARGPTTPRGVMLALAGDGSYRVMKANAFVLQGGNRWQGYLCEAGLESLRVHGNGRIARATCGAGGPVGRLGAPVELPLSPVICDRPACTCVADILITKRRVDALTQGCGLA